MSLLSLTSIISNPQDALTWIPLLPLLGFVLNGFFGRKLTSVGSGMLATATILGSFVLTLVCAYAILWPTGGVVAGVVTSLTDTGATTTAVASHSAAWITGADALRISFGLRMDHLGMIMALIITGVGALIHIYSIGYMSHDKAYWRFFAYLNLFCFAMLCLALGDNMVMLFLGWEGVGLCSYLLIGFWYDDMEKASAGKKAFIANRVGDLGFLIGMFLIFWHFGTLDFTAITEQAMAMKSETSPALLNWAMFFLFVGATGKSAQIPLYVWLPDAMAGPTPVSALIHAATMVTAGVYLFSRMSFVLELTTWVLPLIALIGGLTALMAATIGLVQRDIKKVLAYSTVSQLGFMFIAIGSGAYWVAVFHLMTHAFFKAQLFLGSGSVIHALEHGYGHGNPDAQDMRLMGGLRHKMPITFVTMCLGGAALAGIPFFSGYFSKDEILLMALAREGMAFKIAWGLGLLAAVCTAFYTARLIAMTFLGEFRGDKHVWDHCHESPATMTMPLVILALLALVGGYINLPHLVGHGAYAHLEHFLAGKAVFWESPEPSSGLEIGGLITGAVVAIGFFGAGLMFYRKESSLEKANRLAQGSLKGPFTLLLNKYWVDELYQKLVLRPVLTLARSSFLLIDRLLIDNICVQMPAVLIGMTGQIARQIQTGAVQAYLYLFSAGAVLILLYFLL